MREKSNGVRPTCFLKYVKVHVSSIWSQQMNTMDLTVRCDEVANVLTDLLSVYLEESTYVISVLLGSRSVQ